MTKWRLEEVPRNDGRMLVVWGDDETRGSIIVKDENEAVKWMNAVSIINMQEDLRK